MIEVRQAKRSRMACTCGSGRLAWVEVEWPNGKVLCCDVCRDGLVDRLLSVGWQGGVPAA